MYETTILQKHKIRKCSGCIGLKSTCNDPVLKKCIQDTIITSKGYNRKRIWFIRTRLLHPQYTPVDSLSHQKYCLYTLPVPQWKASGFHRRK